MNTQIVIQGVVKPDGTLELEEKVSLPAGRVQVTLVPMPELPANDPFWQMMRSLWDGQKARGHVPRSQDDVEAERRATREEWEQRMRTIQELQEEARKIREQDA